MRVQEECANLDSESGYSLLFLRHGRKMFKVYIDNMKNFKARYYLVTLFIGVTDVIICDVDLNTTSRHSYKFSNFWCLNSFIVGP